MKELSQTELEKEIAASSAGIDLMQFEREKMQVDDESQKSDTLSSRHEPLYELSPQRQTRDFMEKHGEIIQRREKAHTGKGLRPQHEFVERTEKQQTIQAKEGLAKFSLREMLLGGIEEYQIETGLLPDDAVEVLDISDIEGRYADFFDRLDFKPRNPESINHYLDTSDKIDRLKLLTKMHVGDAVMAVLSDEGAGSSYLLKKLQFYRDLLEGRIRPDSNDGEKYVRVAEAIPPTDISPRNIATGLLRSLLYAEMKGTPELGAYRIALKRQRVQRPTVKQLDIPPTLFGYASDIEYGKEGIGAYTALRDVYQKAQYEVWHDKADDVLANTSPEKLEHAAVLLAATWLAKASEYNDPTRPYGSSYVAKIEEGIAWARLGEPVQRQFRGMRRKIDGVDLHNLSRFVGKAGDDKYGRELRKLHWEVDHFLSDSQQKEGWTTEQNTQEQLKLEKKYQKELARISTHFEKRKTRVLSLDLPEEEQILQLESITQQHQDKESVLAEEYSKKSQRLLARKPDELVEELNQRQEVLQEKHERHKSLAQRALDLHFAFQAERDEDGSYTGQSLDVVDWINDAPFGTIKRAHAALRKGVSREAIIALAVTEIFSGVHEVTRENLEKVQSLVQQNARWQLSKMVSVSSMLQKEGIDADINTIQNIGSKDYKGLHKALKEFSLEEIQASLDKELNLYLLTAVRETMREHGHKLTVSETEAWVGYFDNYRDVVLKNGLGKSLDHFGLSNTRALATAGVFLERAVQIDQLLRKYETEIDIPEIISLSTRIRDDDGLQDFSDAVSHLSFSQAKELLQQGITYNKFVEISSVLAENRTELPFEEITKLALGTSGYELSQALGVFSLEQIKTLIGKGVGLENAISTRRIFREKAIPYSFEEIGILSTQPHYYIILSIELLEYPTTLYLVRNGISLSRATNIAASDALKKHNLPKNKEIILALARHENYAKVIESVFKAGFTVDEIVKYPFLLSPLVSELNKP